MGKRLYIAYGSNLNIRQMEVRCPGARVIGTSEVKDYELLFKGSKTGSYLTIEPKAGASVPVAIWEVSEENELALDHYEGAPEFYYKTEMVLPVKNLKTGKTRRRRAFIYIMREDRALGLPTARYVAVCREGYDAFGFGQRYLTEAIQRSLEGLR